MIGEQDVLLKASRSYDGRTLRHCRVRSASPSLGRPRPPSPH